MTLKYGILSQSTAVFPQSVENVVNTRSCIEKKKYRHIPWNRYNLEKYRDINFWSYRPALVHTILKFTSLNICYVLYQCCHGTKITEYQYYRFQYQSKAQKHAN